MKPANADHGDNRQWLHDIPPGVIAKLYYEWYQWRHGIVTHFYLCYSSPGCASDFSLTAWENPVPIIPAQKGYRYY
jgi:hypothetical protein